MSEVSIFIFEDGTWAGVDEVDEKIDSNPDMEHELITIQESELELESLNPVEGWLKKRGKIR